MTTTAPRRLTIDTIAPIIDGVTRTAPAPMGTWLSRWGFIYSGADLAQPTEELGTVSPLRALPAHVAAA